MEKCARLLVDSSGNIKEVVEQISCNREAITEYPNWFIWSGGVVVFLFVWFLVGYPLWNVWASKKRGEAELQEANRKQQIQKSEATGRRDAAEINKEAAVIEAEAVSLQIEKIGKQLTEHDLYLKWQWIKMMEERPDSSVIYVPTEAGLPILEASRLQKEIKRDS